jgi:hypothetical protein
MAWTEPPKITIHDEPPPNENEPSWLWMGTGIAEQLRRIKAIIAEDHARSKPWPPEWDEAVHNITVVGHTRPEVLAKCPYQVGHSLSECHLAPIGVFTRPFNAQEGDDATKPPQSPD